MTFTFTDLVLRLPNPEHLRLNAAVCQVAHVSGAARYLEDPEVEELRALARYVS